MQKITAVVFVVVALAILSLSGCRYISLLTNETASNSETTTDSNGVESRMFINEKMAELREENADQLVYDTFECLIWKSQDVYVVVISSDAQIVNSILIFSETGELLNQTGITAIHVDDPSSLLQKTEAELVSAYGRLHFDAGSGRYLPAYITDCGSVLVICFESGIVVSITEHQFVQGETNTYGNTVPAIIVTEEDGQD